MNKATISSDIISFTALKDIDKREIGSKVKLLFEELGVKFSKDIFYARMVQGDYLECAMENPKIALRVALIIKTFIKSIALKATSGANDKIKYFKEHAVRMAVAVAPLETLNIESGIIDGDAIYKSGRALKNQSTSDKQKVVIKRTMFFFSNNVKEQETFDTMFALLDTILSKCSAKQCEVVYHKLMGYTEKEISAKLRKNQSTISQHSTASGWYAIEKSVLCFENSINHAI